jgi:hypothetical protein
MSEVGKIICYGRYGFAILIAFMTVMIYYSHTFEQLKTSFIIMIAIEVLAFLLIDYYFEDEMNRLKDHLSDLNKQPLNIEGFDSDISLTALQNLSSMYDDGNLKVTNLDVTGNLKVNGESTIPSITGTLKTKNIYTDTINAKHSGIFDVISAKNNITAGGFVKGKYLQATNKGYFNEVYVDDLRINKNKIGVPNGSALVFGSGADSSKWIYVKDYNTGGTSKRGIYSNLIRAQSYQTGT